MSDTTIGTLREGLFSALPAAAPQREAEPARLAAAGATPAGSESADEREILLEAIGLHTYYGSSHILHGVNFKIRKGEALGLMGRNGMGKTTLIRTMMGYLTPKGGGVLVRGDRMTGGPTHKIAQRGIAYVPEGRGIFPNLSVKENLLMAARAGVDGQREWTFDRVMATFPRLSERLTNGGGQLSGGEQQMLTIGRALMTNPDLLILDEATEGLAPLIVREIWRVIREIRDSGIATVIVDKNHSAITALTDRSMILVKGQVVFDGPSEDVRNNPELIQKHLGV
ncbi:MAG: ABC transporter ATP-binding protein [Aromatoleum sp.]|jgi:branched-chain amino acid transport system ATP-binding protein|uniref:ABC transporter ATP-binding protein n=1 Tax=Aromatoleum sp. TaxID=2307007 RepID=UPI0028957D63|nr:ABC transporter ATP-binding protein [Aromatoleum sp.]MDT3671498.1 ABC transporter ATP-binding protein [Aromatoleum sp.]